MKRHLPKIIGSIINVISLISASTSAKLALKLFSRPKKGRIKPEEKSFLKTSKSEFLQYNNQRIQTYFWEGSGSTVLLAHGWESNSYRWKKLIKELTELQFNVVAMDAPGHGDSGGKEFNALIYAAFMNEVAQKFNPEILIGHSVGGMASIFCAEIYGFENLKKLVLLGSPSNFRDVMNRYTRLMNYNSKVYKALDVLITQRFGNSPDHYSVKNYSGASTIHTLIIHDKNDKIIPYEDALEIHSILKKSRLITTHGFGHSLKHPDVRKYIFEFIDQNGLS